MSTRDWILPERARQEIEKEVDSAFFVGYLLASVITGTVAFLLHAWGLI